MIISCQDRCQIGLGDREKFTIRYIFWRLWYEFVAIGVDVVSRPIFPHAVPGRGHTGFTATPGYDAGRPQKKRYYGPTGIW
jgi:hypothetical protein